MGELGSSAAGPAAAPRENMVAAAARFLRNPKVAHSSDEQKLAFLRQKGLTEEEINEALLRNPAVAYSVERTQTCAFLQTHPHSRLMRGLQAVCNVIVVFFGGGYIIYLIVKRYVLPWLTGQRHKSREQRLMALQTSLDESVRQLNSSLQAVQNQVAEQQRTLEQIGDRNSDPAQLKREISQLKTEVASLKALLLNRHQFAAAPSPPPPAPAIPAWQLVKTPAPADADKGKADSSSSGEIVIVSGNNSDNSEHSDS